MIAFSPLDVILWVAALWAFLLLAAFLALSRLLKRVQASRPFSERRCVALIAGVALIVRLVPDLLLPVGGGYDIESYQVVANLVLSRQDVYASAAALDRHPYLPLQMYWMAFSSWLASISGWSFISIVRLAPIGADVAIALLLFLALRRSVSFDVALRGALLYAVSPVAVFVSAYHGQFDAVPLLFLLLAALTVNGSVVLAGVALGLGILDKSWPVLALPQLLVNVRGYAKQFRFLLLVGAVPLLGIALYWVLLAPASIAPLLGRTLGYDHGIGIWGYSFFLSFPSHLAQSLGGPYLWVIQYGRYLTLAALALVWFVRARFQSPADGILTVLLTFLALTHAFSIQYLVWVVPFALLKGEWKWVRRYTLAAFAYMFLVYFTLIMDMRITYIMPWPQADWFIITPSALPAWLVTLAWLKERLAIALPRKATLVAAVQD